MGTKDADGPVLIDLADVKPGDFGFARFCFRLCDNPGYVWLDSSLESASEGGITEPEREDPDEDYPNGDTVELLDEVQVALLSYDVARAGGNSGGNSDAVLDENDPPVEIGPGMTLREFLGGPVLLGQDSADPGTIPAEEGGGASGRCYDANPAGETNCVTLVWWLPVDHGNELQGDAASFDLGFYTEQCRHNDGQPMGNNGDPPAGGVGEGDEPNGGTDGDQKAISFIAFCAADALSDSDISIDNIDTKNGSEPIEVDWSSTKDVDTVVVKAGNEIENFAGGLSGTVISGTGQAAGPDQSASDPCPDGESGPKYNWDGTKFVLD